MSNTSNIIQDQQKLIAELEMELQQVSLELKSKTTKIYDLEQANRELQVVLTTKLQIDELKVDPIKIMKSEFDEEQTMLLHRIFQLETNLNTANKSKRLLEHELIENKGWMPKKVNYLKLLADNSFLKDTNFKFKQDLRLAEEKISSMIDIIAKSEIQITKLKKEGLNSSKKCARTSQMNENKDSNLVDIESRLSEYVAGQKVSESKLKSNLKSIQSKDKLIDSLRLQIQNLQKTLDYIKSNETKYEALVTDNKKLQSDIKCKKDYIKSLNAQISSLQSELDEWKSKISNMVVKDVFVLQSKEMHELTRELQKQRLDLERLFKRDSEYRSVMEKLIHYSVSRLREQEKVNQAVEVEADLLSKKVKFTD